MNVQTTKRRRGEFAFIDVKAFPLLEVEDRTPATIGPEPADIGQQLWPTEPTLSCRCCGSRLSFTEGERCNRMIVL